MELRTIQIKDLGRIIVYSPLSVEYNQVASLKVCIIS